MASAAAILNGRALQLDQYRGVRKLLHPWDTTGVPVKCFAGDGWPQGRRPRNRPGKVMQR